MVRNYGILFFSVSIGSIIFDLTTAGAPLLENTAFNLLSSVPKFMEFLINVMKEVQRIAKAEGVKNTETMIDEALVSFNKMIPDGKTSMLQDVEAKRKTEVEMFGSTMVKFGKKHNIPTPYNLVMRDMLEIIHENYQG